MKQKRSITMIGILFFLLLNGCRFESLHSPDFSSEKDYSMEEAVSMGSPSNTSEYETNDTGTQTEEWIIEANSRSEAISEYNHKSLAIPELQLYDLRVFSESIPGDEVREKIASYTLPEDCLFDGEPLTLEEKETLYHMSATDEVPEQVLPGYACTNQMASLRSFPTDSPLQRTKDGFDLLQETGIPPAVPVLILHQTKDSSWCFVLCEFYSGWIKRDCLSILSGDEWKALYQKFQEGEGVLICDYVSVDQYFLPMGTLLPIEKIEGNTAAAYIPGDYGASPARFTFDLSDERFCLGFMPYSDENLSVLGNRILGIPYGWGDAGGFPDCSSTIRNLYRCFGYVLPRNSSSFPCLPAEKIMTADLDMTVKRELIRDLPFGSILHVKGHVMLYWGNDSDGEPLFFHNIDRYYSQKEDKLVENPGCSISHGSICDSSKTPYYEKIDCILILPENGT